MLCLQHLLLAAVRCVTYLTVGIKTSLTGQGGNPITLKQGCHAASETRYDFVFARDHFRHIGTDFAGFNSHVGEVVLSLDKLMRGI